MVQKADLAGIDPTKLRADRIEKEIDSDLDRVWPLYKRQSVAYSYEIKCVPALKEVALEVAGRYRKAGWKVDIFRRCSEEGRWATATLEFRGEEG